MTYRADHCTEAKRSTGSETGGMQRSSSAMVQRLRPDGWEVATEVSFNVYGERGSIDILAFHAADTCACS